MKKNFMFKEILLYYTHFKFQIIMNALSNCYDFIIQFIIAHLALHRTIESGEEGDCSSFSSATIVFLLVVYQSKAHCITVIAVFSLGLYRITVCYPFP